MKDTKKLFEAMSGIDEDLLARSEEYAQKKSGQKKIIPFIKYVSTAAAAVCAIFVIGVVVMQTPKQSAGMSATKNESARMVDDAVQSAPMYEETTKSEFAGASDDRAANENVEAAAEASCEAEQDWSEEEKTDSKTLKPDVESNLAGASKYFAIPGMKNKVSESTLGEVVNQATQPVGSEYLQAPTEIPERYTFNIGMFEGEEVDCDVAFELNDEVIKKHVKDMVVNTWRTGGNTSMSYAVAPTTNDMLLVANYDMLLVAYYTVDDRVEAAEELENLPGVVLDVEDLTVEKFEEIIQTNKDAGNADTPVLNFWVWYREDTLIYFAGNVTPEEGMEIMNSIR